MSRIAQKLPPEEVQKTKINPTNLGNKFREWAEKWKDMAGFAKSVWDNPYEFDVNWHEENARKRQRNRGQRLNWLQWARLTPKLRNLYKNR